MSKPSSKQNHCAYYQSGSCRSCAWMDFPYTEQIEKKEFMLISALSRFTHAGFKPEPACQSSLWGFRNRAKLSVLGTTESPILGILEEDHLDRGIDLLECPIHHPKLNALISALPDYIREFNLIPYHIPSQRGELKGVILFHSPESNETYLRFILRSQECISRIRKCIPRIQAQFPHLVCITANLQPVPHAILEGREEFFLTERHHIHHRLGDIELNLSPKAFVQTNAEVAHRLYQTAAEWISETRPKRMLDLYCGQGFFSFFAAKSAHSILGLELNDEAVSTANETAQALHLNHLRFESMDARKISIQPADLILVNPPRRGLAEGVIPLLEMKPKTIVYSSCSLESLAKDMETLGEHYLLKRAQVFDLFPHTTHFEILTLLELKTTA